ncbi:MAG: ORF6N domain-containing protein [Candidatus Woesearchaeota archaeon]
MKEIVRLDSIQSKIFTIRGVQVMLDKDLADFYQIETKRLNEQVKRNNERFPKKFMFQLTKEEKDELVANCDRLQTLKFSTSLPYAFTEQGVSMLSAVLNSKIAIQISIKIIEAFVQIRNFLLTNEDTFKRLNVIETKLLEHDNNFKELFDSLNKRPELTFGIFYEGEFFDSYEFISNLISKAKKEIILIDNYVDENTLSYFKKTNALVTIYTKNVTNELEQSLEKYNCQYKSIQLLKFTLSHDRFLIIDDETYHIGASLKDVGKKWFAFSKIDLTKEIKKKLLD